MGRESFPSDATSEVRPISRRISDTASKISGSPMNALAFNPPILIVTKMGVPTRHFREIYFYRGMIELRGFGAGTALDNEISIREMPVAFSRDAALIHNAEL